MAPTLVASYFVQTASPSNTALTTPAFTPSNGEVIVVKMETWDHTISMGSVTGGGQTYTSRVTVAPTGFRPWVGITTAVISGSPGSMTVSATPSVVAPATARYSMTVERWSGAQLAGTPAVGSANGGSGAANGTLTTTAANSVVSWTAGDSQSLNPSTRVYLNSATEDGLRDNHVGANGVGYHAYQTAASAGSQTFGLSAPTGMQWCIAGIEIQAAAGEPAPAEGSVDASVDYDVTLAGVRGSAGQLGTAVGYNLALFGSRESAGTLGPGIAYDVQLGGARPSAGTLAPGIGWDINLAGSAPSVSGAEGDLQLGVDYKLQLAGARDALGALGFGLSWDIELVGARPSAGALQFKLGYEPALVGPAAPGGSAHFSPRATADAGDGPRTAPTATWSHRQTATAAGR